MSHQTIDDVITRLDLILERCHERGSRLGFFPAMYRKTTLEVKKGIETGRFEDPARLERLDVVFAERYFQAFEKYQQGQVPTRAWNYSFQMGRSHYPSVIQHLLLGMNAHINLDLGISAAEISRSDDLSALKHDFDEINVILGELIDRIQEDLASVFPAVGALDELGGTMDERVFHFSIKRARNNAWRKAEILAQLSSEADAASHIRAFDRETVRLAKIICPPRWLSKRLLTTPEQTSPHRIRHIIEALVD